MLIISTRAKNYVGNYVCVVFLLTLQSLAIVWLKCSGVVVSPLLCCCGGRIVACFPSVRRSSGRSSSGLPVFWPIRFPNIGLLADSGLLADVECLGRASRAGFLAAAAAETAILRR